MKRIFYLFLLAFLPKIAAGQVDTAIIVFELDTPTVRYYLDTIRIDSFFLLEQTSTPGGGPRPSVLYSPTYFTDTTAFNQYIDAMYDQVAQLSVQFAALKLQRDVFAYRILRLEYLRDSIFRGVTGVPEVRSVAPPPTSPLKIPTDELKKPAKGTTTGGKRKQKNR
jgi:hypothetical protein